MNEFTFCLACSFYNLLILNNNVELHHELMPKIGKYRRVVRTLPNIYDGVYLEKIISNFWPLTIFAKGSIIDAWQGPKYPLKPLTASPTK